MIIQINNNSGMSNLKALALVTNLERNWKHREGRFYQDLKMEGVQVQRKIVLEGGTDIHHRERATVTYTINPPPSAT